MTSGYCARHTAALVSRSASCPQPLERKFRSLSGSWAPVAPHALQRRVLETELAVRSLDGVQRANVVGIALLPGTLRQPLGFSRALVGPDDYRGAAFGIRAGGVAEASVRALGARAVTYVSGRASDFDGAELDYSTIGDSSYDQEARALTANVVLWPRIQTVVMNRAAFDGLTPEQQEILRRAGREAVEPEQAAEMRPEPEHVEPLTDGGGAASPAHPAPPPTPAALAPRPAPTPRPRSPPHTQQPAAADAPRRSPASTAGPRRPGSARVRPTTSAAAVPADSAHTLYAPGC